MRSKQRIGWSVLSIGPRRVNDIELNTLTLNEVYLKVDSNR